MRLVQESSLPFLLLRLNQAFSLHVIFFLFKNKGSFYVIFNYYWVGGDDCLTLDINLSTNDVTLYDPGPGISSLGTYGIVSENTFWYASRDIPNDIPFSGLTIFWDFSIFSYCFNVAVLLPSLESILFLTFSDWYCLNLISWANFGACLISAVGGLLIS